MECSGVPTQDGSSSSIDPYVTIMRLAQYTRGPSINPSLIASRTATSVNQVPPGTEILVTPDRSTC
jgi:hypothetical protein